MKNSAISHKVNVFAFTFFVSIAFFHSSVFGQTQTKIGHVNGETLIMLVSSGTLSGAFSNEMNLHSETIGDTILSASLFYYSGNYFLHGSGRNGIDTVGGWAPLTIDGNNDLYLSTAPDAGPGVCSGNCCSCDGIGCPCTGGVGTPPYSCKSSSLTFYYGPGNLGGFY